MSFGGEERTRPGIGRLRGTWAPTRTKFAQKPHLATKVGQTKDKTGLENPYAVKS